VAIVKVYGTGRTISDDEEVRGYLSEHGVLYRKWTTPKSVPLAASPEEVLESFAHEIDKLKEEGGYSTPDVIDVRPDTPRLEEMLAKFRREHWHDEDEVRFMVHGRGVFHIHPASDVIMNIEVGAGDLIGIPRGTWHWFDLCSERTIRAIRLFRDQAGWVPRYTDSRLEEGYQPLCMGQPYPPADKSSIRL
jgi:1,2-dihydroxy-3-keto-5-methylthiopentene dioxygenase